ncbi:hypothetical protein LEL_05461 [Akanthomyces lecanii RCEF 1005]|uniref:Uncharacterized protein n=1 Tax=Akanthomyces lecanii RCEF 1005 TaxID=1081108 RepID=A0A162KR27_CORDF|nr:hypothetical protein LEL_05461 [Akanthomyces lecanii RCEF 1005]
MATPSQLMNATWFLELFANETDAARHHYPAHALCLVNLAFNAVFSRVLYNIVHVEEYADDTAASLRMLQQAAQSQHLAATKTLEIIFLDHTGTCRKKNSINHGNLKRFRALVADVFDKMPNLARLHCTNYASFDDKWMRDMEELPKLESLILHDMSADDQSEMIVADKTRAENPAYFRGPSSFSALKSLKLLEMQYGIVDWPKYIASFMLHARGLEELELTAYYEECDDTLVKACENYASRCEDGRRVRLKTLCLGKQMHTPTVHVLRKAFDLSALETIDVTECDYGLAVVEPDVLEVCDPAVTPNLRSITIGELAYDNWRRITKVTTGRSFFRADCAGFWHENELGRNVYELAKLNRAPQLRLSYPRTEEGCDYGTLLKCVSNCDWLTHLALYLMLDDEPGNDRAQSTQPMQPTLEQLEAALPALCEVLATLSRLKVLQVHLATNSQVFKKVGHLEHSIMAAKMMAKACPALQYINIGRMTFVTTWPTPAPASTKELEPVVRKMNMLTESAEAVLFFEADSDV